MTIAIRILLTGVALAGLAATPALASGKFRAPEGCTVYQTVQLHNCQVAQLYRCDGDAAGDQWALYSDGEGPFYLSRIDAETRWIESYDLTTGERDQIAEEADPASFTALLESGRDSYDFTTKSNTGEVRRYHGFDELTGETVRIDGVTLDQTRFELTAEGADGERIYHRSGKQFIQRDWRVFFADRETFEGTDGARREIAEGPVTFAGPETPGYLKAEPEFDCNSQMTDVAPLPGGAS